MSKSVNIIYELKICDSIILIEDDTREDIKTKKAKVKYNIAPLETEIIVKIKKNKLRKYRCSASMDILKKALK